MTIFIICVGLMAVVLTVKILKVNLLVLIGLAVAVMVCVAWWS